MGAAIHRGASPKVEYIVHKHAGNTHTTKQAWTWIPGDGFLAPGPPFSKGQYQGQYQKLDEHTAGSAKASNHGHPFWRHTHRHILSFPQADPSLSAQLG